MRLGIIIDDVSTIVPTIANFEQCILNSLNKLNVHHKISVFTYSDVKNNEKIKHLNFEFININDFNSKIKFLRIRLILTYLLRQVFKKLGFANRFKIKNVMDGLTSLNRALYNHKIDLVWMPFCIHYVDGPYIMNCMDVNYRINPFLPEERLKALEWNNYNLMRTNIMQRATYVITSTTSGKNELSRYFNIAEDRIKKIPFFTPKIEQVDFTDHQLSRIDLDKLPNVFLFYPARLIPHKNHVTILLALKYLKDEYNIKIDFVFVGQDKGNLKYVRQQISDLQLTDVVHYYGSVSFQDLDLLYRKAFALVYASINGPDNLPPLEAFEKGCPVIASNLSGTEEQLGDCALVFDKLDYKQLANHIHKLLKDNSLRETLIQKGLARANSFTADDYVLEVLKVVDEYNNYIKLWDGTNYKP